MPSPRFPATATLLDGKVCPLEKFDALFAKITQERMVSDGYFLQAHPEETWILFVVNGSPYAAGRLGNDAFGFGEIHEFFAVYARQPQSPLSFLVADKRLLLGMMVLFRHRPARQFTTDLVDTGEILREVAARGTDAILGLCAGDEWAIAICNKGQPVANYFPPSGAEALREAAPSAQLLAYVFTRPFGGVAVNVYEETRVDPAGDAILATPRTRSRLSTVFLRVASKVQEAEAASQREREVAPAEVAPFEPAQPSVALPEVALPEVTSPEAATEPAAPLQAEEPVVATGEEMAAPETAPAEVAQPSEPPAPAPIQGPIPEVFLFLGDKVLGTFSLGKQELTIGRNPGNDILIDNVGVSRRHAVIRWSGDQFVVEDLGSANGTFVNGQRITSSALKDGDEILVLKHRLVYRVPKEDVAPQVEAPRDTGEQTMYIEPAAVAQAAAGRPDTPGPKLRPRLILPDLTKFALEAGEVTLGSGADCQIRLSGLFVARAHARIVPEREGQFKIIHLGGLSGTRVNGEKISEHVLKHGDEIVIAKQKLLFRLER